MSAERRKYATAESVWPALKYSVARYFVLVGSSGNSAPARRNEAMAESLLLACQAATPALNTGTHITRRQAAMSSLHAGFSVSARANAVSSPAASLVRM